MSSVVSLDFDGVLHRASDKVHISFGPHTPIFQMQVALQAQQRFKWNAILQEIVERATAGCVESEKPMFMVHSTWRLKFSDEQIRFFMPPAVANRMISLDSVIEPSFRRNASSDQYLARALESINCSRLLVIDDRPDIFRTGLVQQWMDHPGHEGQFLWCDPELGISDSEAIAGSLDWLCQCRHHSDSYEQLTEAP